MLPEGDTGECPPSRLEKIHAPLIFAPVYKRRIIDLNFVPQHAKMLRNAAFPWKKSQFFFWEGDIPSSHPAPSASCPPCEPSGCVLGVAYTYVLSIDLLTARISLLAGLQKQCALPTDHCCQYGQDDARVHPVRAPAAAMVT